MSIREPNAHGERFSVDVMSSYLNHSSSRPPTLMYSIFFSMVDDFSLPFDMFRSHSSTPPMATRNIGIHFHDYAGRFSTTFVYYVWKIISPHRFNLCSVIFCYNRHRFDKKVIVTLFVKCSNELISVEIITLFLPQKEATMPVEKLSGDCTFSELVCVCVCKCVLCF